MTEKRHTFYLSPKNEIRLMSACENKFFNDVPSIKLDI